MAGTVEGRKLSVLVLDDQPPAVIGQYAGLFRYFETRIIESWTDAQLVLAIEGDVGGADLLLIDVSFDTKDDVAKSRDRGLPFVPVGPLLALPFIGKRSVLACEIYSGHIKNPELHKHPYFLMAMGLILARVLGSNELSGRALTSEHLATSAKKKGQLDIEVACLAARGPTNAHLALEIGAESYRDRLKEAVTSGKVIVLNAEEVQLAVAAMIKMHSESGQDVPFNDKLCLSVTGPNGRDSIRVDSLFADVLNREGGWATISTVAEVEQWVGELGAETCFSRAIRAAEAQDGNPVATMLENAYGGLLTREQMAETLRLCILFANVWAIDNPDPKFGVKRSSVYEYLAKAKEGENGKVSPNIYFKWFGERRGSSGGNTVSVRGCFAKLEPLSIGDNKFARCFLFEEGSSTRKSVTAKDYQVIRQYRAYLGLVEWSVPPFDVI